MRPTTRPHFIALLACSFSALAASTSLAADAPESPMVKLLRAGKVPAERQGTVIDMIGKRGGAADLDFLLERAITGGFSPVNQIRALEALGEASLTRGIRPSGDPARLAPLVEKPGADPAARSAAVRLAGLWKAEALGSSLRTIAGATETPGTLRASALDALAAIGGKEGRDSIEALTAPGKPVAVRSSAVAALARLDLAAAAGASSGVLAEAAKSMNVDDVLPLLSAFLNRRGGPDALAAALTRDKLSADAAKVALRGVYTLGHSDPGLVSSLTKAAGLDAEVKPLDPKAMEALIADVATKGDPARGEVVFRRGDVNCAKCHALSGAGGGVGPDLSPLGSSSPVDYIINSIMLPDQAIKEEFHTLVVALGDGQILQGIVADKDDKRIVLRDATGALRTVPTSEVEDTKEGGSLMPKGLVNFMTRAEFVDLVRFLSELGKPGPYAIRSTPTVQRWRVFQGAPTSASDFLGGVYNAEPSRWLPAYAKTGGALPLDELTREAGPVVFLQAEVEVSQAGQAVIKLDSAEGVTAWVDDRIAPSFVESALTTGLAVGRRKLTFRVDTQARRDKSLRVEVLKGPGSKAEYAVVGGR